MVWVVEMHVKLELQHRNDRLAMVNEPNTLGEDEAGVCNISKMKGS